MEVGEGTRKRCEDFLGEAEVDPFLQQHDSEVAVRCGLKGGCGERRGRVNGLGDGGWWKGMSFVVEP